MNEGCTVFFGKYYSKNRPLDVVPCWCNVPAKCDSHLVYCLEKRQLWVDFEADDLMMVDDQLDGNFHNGCSPSFAKYVVSDSCATRSKTYRFSFLERGA